MKRSRTCFDVRSFDDESGPVGKRCDSCPALTGISCPTKLDARIYSVSSLGNKLPDDGTCFSIGSSHKLKTSSCSHSKRSAPRITPRRATVPPMFSPASYPVSASTLPSLMPSLSISNDDNESECDEPSPKHHVNSHHSSKRPFPPSDKESKHGRSGMMMEGVLCCLPLDLHNSHEAITSPFFSFGDEIDGPQLWDFDFSCPKPNSSVSSSSLSLCGGERQLSVSSSESDIQSRRFSFDMTDDLDSDVYSYVPLAVAEKNLSVV